MIGACHSTIVAEDAERIVDELADPLGALADTTRVVTGAQGFLGSYFVEVGAALNDRRSQPRCRVLAVDNFRTGIRGRLAHLEGRPDVVLLDGDASKPLALDGSAD